MTLSEASAETKLTAIETLRQEVLDMVFQSKRRLTPKDLEKRICQKFSISKNAFKTVVKNLVADGELVYTYTFGRSFLEKSFNKPVRISKRIILKPPGMFYRPESDEIVVKLQHGASFGTGEHPTTRLAAEGIEEALSTKEFFQKDKYLQALDIGTGSGILSIIAVLMGVKKAVGTDVDPCARSEARNNIKLNRLENRIEIHDSALEQIDQKFSIITANLRYPTLRRLCRRMVEKMEKGGLLVISGVKTDEIPGLLNTYEQHHLRCVWKKIEKD